MRCANEHLRRFTEFKKRLSSPSVVKKRRDQQTEASSLPKGSWSEIMIALPQSSCSAKWLQRSHSPETSTKGDGCAAGDRRQKALRRLIHEILPRVIPAVDAAAVVAQLALMVDRGAIIDSGARRESTVRQRTNGVGVSLPHGNDLAAKHRVRHQSALPVWRGSQCCKYGRPSANVDWRRRGVRFLRGSRRAALTP